MTQCLLDTFQETPMNTALQYDTNSVVLLIPWYHDTCQLLKT